MDPETLKQFKKLEQRDRRRWTVADRDKNLQLSKEEFKGFIHPEYYEHMYSVNRDETMADLDTDGDGKLSLSEFVVHMYGSTEGLEVADWDSAGIQFRQFRDHNKDGFIDKDELMVGGTHSYTRITLDIFRCGYTQRITTKTRQRPTI